MKAPVIRSEVRTFVAAVRAALDDLTPEEIEELTGGLEADLDDALTDDATLADHAALTDDGPPGGAGSAGSLAAVAEPPGGQGELAARLGDPEAYAAELRAAAGLPPRAGGGAGRGRPGVVDALQRSWSRRHGQVLWWLESRPWWPVACTYAGLLRPAWWLLRAWIAFQFLHGVIAGRPYGAVLPLSLVSWVIAVALLWGSVEIGRRVKSVEVDAQWYRRSRRLGWARRLLGLANVFAVLMLPLALDHTDRTMLVYGDAYPVPPADGLWLNGTEVRNIFPYDAQGRPLSGVQLFDENGNRLTVGSSARTPLSDVDGNQVAQVPAVGQDSSQLWNVFPLRQQVIPPFAEPTPPAHRTMPHSAPQPSAQVGPLLAPTPGAASAPSAGTGSVPEGGSAPTSAPAPMGMPMTTPVPTAAPNPGSSGASVPVPGHVP